MLDVMNKNSGIPITDLRVDSGASRQPLPDAVPEHITGVPVDRPALVETTTMGAAFLAGLAAGVWSDPDDVAHTRRRERRFKPKMDKAHRKSLYDAGSGRSVES